MIRDLLTSPEAQSDPYVWSAVLLAHALVGAASFLAGMLLFRRGRASAIAALALWVAWEGAQAAFFDGSVADGLTDFAANVFGICIAWALWLRRADLAGIAMAILGGASWWRMRR